MGRTLWIAFALMLVFEGLLPLLAPASWRELFRKLMELNDGQLRFFGLMAVFVGLGTLFLLTPRS